MQHSRVFLCLGLVLASLLSQGTALAEPDTTYLQALQSAARDAKVAQTREWRDLLHYERGRFGRGWRSLVVSPDFFLSPDGRHDPQAELDATLAAFFSKSETATGQHPQCAYIARYQWLRERLDFDPERLPPHRCARFEDWYAAIDPGQATLVFPAAYLNSPSSMFGHTLLRLDPAEGRTRLDAYAINYAAQTTETNGLAFALLGLTGGYPGNFSIMPYYSKVNEYNAIENRDIWEYELNLEQRELRRLLEHAWELGPVHFDYYFFDDNCSYMLLSLLDVARPGMGLTDDFGLYAIPNDTVRAVLAEEEMLRDVAFRPSNQTEIAHRLRFLDREEETLALALAEGKLSADAAEVGALDSTRQAQVLDVASRYVQYRAKDISAEARRERYLELLRARSRHGRDETAPIARPESRPDEGHGSGRVALGVGQSAGEDFAELRFRPAYHDLMDPTAGYTPGAQINFLDVSARYDAERERLRLQGFDLVDVFSLSPRSRFFKPVSWRARVAWERIPVPGHADALVFGVRAGAGLSYGLGDAQVFGLLQGAALVDDDLRKGRAFGAGPLVGVLWDVTPRWKLWLSARVEGYQEMTYREHKLEQGFALGRDLSLRLTFTRDGISEAMRNTGQVSLRWYF